MIMICHLYAEAAGLYGDNGNVTVFQKRCFWRDIPYTTDRIKLGEEVDFSRYHMVFLGGGSHKELLLAAADLRKRRNDLLNAIEQGLVVLAVGSGYQLLGEYCQSSDGVKASCLDILDFYTLMGDKRLVGPSAAEAELDDDALAHLLRVAGRVAREQGLHASGYRLVSNCGAHACQTVPHLHLHILGGNQLTGRMG